MSEYREEMEAAKAKEAERLFEEIIKQHPKAINVKEVLVDMCKLLIDQEARIFDLEELLGAISAGK